MRARMILRYAIPVAILSVILVRVGVKPFVDAVRDTDAASLALATAVTALTTVFAAWRWQTVAAGLGVRIPLGPAVLSYYRSQFLNLTLPFGVMGDVHRGVIHGRTNGGVALGLRAVAWERFCGQVVATALTLGVLSAVSWSGRPVVAVGMGTAAVVGIALVLALAPGSRRTILIASALATLGHVVVFLIAVRMTAPELSLLPMLPIGLVVLVAAAVPLNLAGWGPREGAAAYVFVVAGHTAAQGVAVSAAFGVLALGAALPGAVVVLLSRSEVESPKAEPILEAADA